MAQGLGIDVVVIDHHRIQDQAETTAVWSDAFCGAGLAACLRGRVGKIHPNEFVTLSMFNNDERTQFLNGANDGNLAVASDGTYAGGGAVEFQANRYVYVHAVAVDTEGAQQSNIETLVDRKYMESFEVGWSFGPLGEQYRHYRAGMWRDDTKKNGSRYGGQGYVYLRSLGIEPPPFWERD